MISSMLLAFLLFFQVGRAQSDFPGLRNLLTAGKKELGNHTVMLIYQDGKPVFLQESGELKADSQEPMAYASQWLTAALVMTFVEEGKLSLDDPVSNYLPIFASYSKAYITVRHCLAQTTGIESEPKRLGRILPRPKASSLEEEVNNFASKKDIIDNPGKEFRFGSVGINIAGRVVEVISKRKTFARLMQERIFKPLGMKKSTFMNDRGGAENPSTGLISTANDYMKFLMMLLNNGEYNGKRVLSAASVEEMFKPQTGAAAIRFVPKPLEGSKYGFGTWIEETGSNGQASLVSCPALQGTVPYIDLCRKYACIFLTRPVPGEPNMEAYTQLREEIGKEIKSECK